MKVIFEQNCIYNGIRYEAGQELEITDAQAKSLGALVKKVQKAAAVETVKSAKAVEAAEPAPTEAKVTKTTAKKKQ